ncbi:FAD-binding oxidoreductase [Chitinophaga sp. Hz27]|uniref:FAD-binding oxidoreductase n=1 Tax=Chitinophaga sp. Hz27 TaxID=3347169 RepID=UPI0035E1BDAD
MDEQLMLLNKLRVIVGEGNIITDLDAMQHYALECTLNKLHMPAAVVIPATTEEISAIAALCNENRVPLTVRGGGTGVSGGTLSPAKGIILSLERLNRIIEINKIDMIAVVEAGVVTKVLQEAVLEEGLCFPQNISSAAACFIGGNVAVASGSPKSLKYGPTRNYVLNLEVVLPNGNIIWTGKNITKNATGYNFTQLFAGSEGSLGIITKVVLKLVPPTEEILVLIPFNDINRLFDCVHHLFLHHFSASSIEFVDKPGYELVADFLQTKLPAASTLDGLLWIELEGKNTDLLMMELEMLSGLISSFTTEEMLVAQSESEIRRLWSLRSRIGDAVINRSTFRDVDIVVPRSCIHQMYTAIKAIAGAHHINYTAFGHIGNGNFHINILRENIADEEQWEILLNDVISRIFDAAIALGGTLSGEHGTGKYQLPYLEKAISASQLDLMKQIKLVFDPNSILNS